MSNTMEKRDEDEEYLYSVFERVLSRKPTEAQIEKFCEKVSIMIIDGLLDEPTARRLALKEVMI